MLKADKSAWSVLAKLLTGEEEEKKKREQQMGEVVEMSEDRCQDNSKAGLHWGDPEQLAEWSLTD